MAEIGLIDINLALDKALYYNNKRVTRLQYTQKVEQTQISAYGALQTLFENFQTQLNNVKNVFNGVNSEITSSNSSVATAETINSNLSAGTHTLVVNTLARAAIKASNADMASRTAAANVSGTLTLTNNQNSLQTFSIAVDNSDSLETIRDKINTASNNIGITASIINTTDDLGNAKYVLLLTGKTGTANDFTATGSAATALDIGIQQTAVDADVTLDNFRIVRSSNVITDAMDGLKLTLNSLGTTNLSISSTQDDLNSDVKEAIGKMLSSYNQIITFLDANQNVTLYDDKNPENTATAHNTAFQFIKSRLQAAVNTPYDGSTVFHHLTDIGMKYSAAEKVVDQYDTQKVTNSFGSFAIDTTILSSLGDKNKFDWLLENKFSEVKDFFTSSTGFIATVNNVMTSSILNKGPIGMITNAVENINQQLSNTADKISSEREGIEKLRSDLILQYSTINATLQKLQYESDYLTKQYDYLGSLVKNK